VGSQKKDVLMSKDKDKKPTAEHHHPGSVAPEDEELTRFLNKMWARNEPPERVEVWQVFGKEKRDRGEMIFHEDFGPGRKLDVEQANHLANEIIAAAQNDCESTPKRREAYYQIAVIDRNRRSVPLTRRLGPLRPTRNLSLARSSDPLDDADGDEEELSLRSLEHNRLKTGFEEARWGANRNDRVLGELLMLMGSLITEQREENRGLRVENREAYRIMQDELDRSTQRKIALEKEKFKFDLLQEGVRGARNLLPGLFAEAKSPSPSDGDDHGSNGSNGNGHSNGAPKNYGTSPERALVDNFLHDCEKAGIIDKLFGECEELGGKLVITKPGVFGIKQIYIMNGVRGGHLPVTALDPLMPGSGHAEAITEDQIKQAMENGVTDGIGTALMELLALRKRAKEVRTPVPPNDNPPEASAQ
jgi:hypothetical protein